MVDFVSKKFPGHLLDLELLYMHVNAEYYRLTQIVIYLISHLIWPHNLRYNPLPPTPHSIPYPHIFMVSLYPLPPSAHYIPYPPLYSLYPLPPHNYGITIPLSPQLTALYPSHLYPYPHSSLYPPGGKDKTSDAVRTADSYQRRKVSFT